MIGFSFTVKIGISYVLKDTQSGNTVWRRTSIANNTRKSAKRCTAFRAAAPANEGGPEKNIGRQSPTGGIDALT